MDEVPVEKLIDGRTYRIESRDGMHRPFIGRLRLGSEPFGFPPEFYRSFDKVILDPYEPRSLYGWGPQPTDLEYAEITRSRFFNSPKSLRYNQAYRGVGELPLHYSRLKAGPKNRLSAPLSENSLGIIKGFVEGSNGPYEINARPDTGLVNPYPPRINNKNAEKAKKPRTRKNKRKSRKTNKSKKSRNSRKS